MIDVPTYLHYVAGFEGLLSQGRKQLPLAMPRPELADVAADAPVCLLFSPHPDDEAISGGLAWRLRRECGWRVVNVAVTLGSHRARRAERWRELSACCAYLGFELVSASGEALDGLERVVPQTVQQDPSHWAHCVLRVADLLRLHRPALVICPHDNDGHAAHVGTHLLVMYALRQVGTAVSPHVALAEFWNTQSNPGLMVQLSTPDVAALVTALSLHEGEVARNPYQLTLPAWFIDGVRRGTERVGAPGSKVPPFTFATLYGWQHWTGTHCVPLGARTLAISDSPSSLFA